MFIFVIIVLILVVIIRNIRIVGQTQAYVIERLGVYQTTWHAGIHVKMPIIDHVARRVELKEQVVDFAPQDVITKDNVTMKIDTVVFFQITNPKLYAYGVVNPIFAIENLTATTLRNIIGEMELDETLTSREKINGSMSKTLDVATDPWGIKVNRVELKNIIPPRAIQEAMEKQMKAERERREAILIAEGEKKSAVLRAEGEQESAVLRADALKTELVKEAEGHSESIRLHQQAEAEGVKMLIEAGLTPEQVVRLKSLQTLEKAADGKATKIIIPSDLQAITGFAEGVKEAIEGANKSEKTK